MKVIVFPFVLAALVGFGFAFWLHWQAINGIRPDDQLTFTRMALWGVALPILFFVQGEVSRVTGRRKTWKIIMASSPAWMRWATYGSIGYAVLTMVLCVIHGLFFSAVKMRPPFSGDQYETAYYLTFLWIVFVFGYTWIFHDNRFPKRVCVNNHPVEPPETVCGECGEKLAEDLL